MVLKSRTEFTIPQRERIAYTGFVTVILERETLTGVDPETRQALEDAADSYAMAPARLQAAILAAARQGDKPALIARAISYVYTYDYVARLIRSDRRANPGLYPRAKPES